MYYLLKPNHLVNKWCVLDSVLSSLVVIASDWGLRDRPALHTSYPTPSPPSTPRARPPFLQPTYTWRIQGKHVYPRWNWLNFKSIGYEWKLELVWINRGTRRGMTVWRTERTELGASTMHACSHHSSRAWRMDKFRVLLHPYWLREPQILKSQCLSLEIFKISLLT